MKIQKIKDVAFEAGIKAILYGPSGSGKTYSIATIPNPETVIVLSAEAGLLSIREAAANVDVAQIATVQDLRDAYAYLSGEGGAKYRTVVLDSLSEIAQQVLSDEMDKTKDGRKAYGEMNEKVVTLIKTFRDLHGKNVILLCQMEKTQDDDGKIFHAPAMPGKRLAQGLPYLTDLVTCLRVARDEEGNVKRAFQFAAQDEMYQAKDRSGKLAEFETPDWSVVFAKINGATAPMSKEKK